jgi:hypothetical protein
MRSRVLTTALTMSLATLVIHGAPAVARDAGSVPLAAAPRAAAPPFEGTIFIDPDIITADSKTVFKRATYQGRDKRQVFDRRKNRFVTIRAFVFKLRFKGAGTVDAVVDPEFRTKRVALAQARKYARVTGRLPAMLRRDVDELWIHRGKQPFGGGNGSLLIHTGQAKAYERAGILEEALAHEAVHTSLDAGLAASAGWLAAQAADATYVSTYAQANPPREDLAESVVPWLAVRFARDRLDPATAQLIEQTIPNRLAFLDQQAFDTAPYAR